MEDRRRVMDRARRKTTTDLMRDSTLLFVPRAVI